MPYLDIYHKCLTLIYKGCRHWCTKTQRLDNIEAVTDETDKDRIMHLQMKNKIGSTQADEDGFHEIRTKTSYVYSQGRKS